MNATTVLQLAASATLALTSSLLVPQARAEGSDDAVRADIHLAPVAGVGGTLEKMRAELRHSAMTSLGRLENPVWAVEAGGFPSAVAAALAFGLAYDSNAAAEQRDLTAGIVDQGPGGFGYTHPLAGAVNDLDSPTENLVRGLRRAHGASFVALARAPFAPDRPFGPRELGISASIPLYLFEPARGRIAAASPAGPSGSEAAAR